jgi:enterochelin esterase-like enzyme
MSPKSSRPPDEVFILNHGWSDRPETMLAALGLDRIYAGLLRQGKVRPALVVLPDVRFPETYRNNPEARIFPVYLDLVAEEISRIVVQEYGIPFSHEQWGIGGFSFGGLLSLDVGRRFPGRFGSVSAVSAPRENSWLFWPAGPASDTMVKSARGPQSIVVPGPIPRLFLACGTSDRYFKDMLGLRQEFQKRGISHEWSEKPGGHTWGYWSTVIESMFLFHLGHGKKS